MIPIAMKKSGLALARLREKQMLERMNTMWHLNEEQFRKALADLGLKPGTPDYERAMTLWRDQQ
jgi:hypothetical protein